MEQDADINYEQPTIPENEKKIEASIQAKNLNAPRLSPTQISEQVVSEEFHTFYGDSKGSIIVVCCLELQNKYRVIGQAGVVSSENFDIDIGKRIARDNARKEIWQLEGYILRSKLSKTI